MSYLIRYSKIADPEDTLIELPSIWRLLLWLAWNAHKCRAIRILMFYSKEDS